MQSAVCRRGIEPGRIRLNTINRAPTAVDATRGLHRILIVGGGAGGLPLAVRLGETLGKRRRAEITLVDRYATHLWKPLLHEVAAGRMDGEAHGVDYLALAHWHGFRFRLGAVADLDRHERMLGLAAVQDDDGREMLPRRRVAYDTLVFAVGSISNDFGIPGVAAHAMSLDTAADAERFHRRLLAACVRADARAAQGARATVDIVIVGAGATGVELAAEIRQMTRVHAGYGLDHLDAARDIRLTLVEAAPRILPPLIERIAVAAAGLLADLDVVVRTGVKVTGIDDEGVHTVGGELIPADLIVWTAGIQAPPWLAQMAGLEVNRANQLIVDTRLVTTRDPDIFAFGDCAACPWPEAGKPGAIVPPRAQTAHQQSALLVHSLTARLAGGPLREYRYRDFGSLVSLGAVSAVGSLMGRLVGGTLFIEGLVARWTYAALYKQHQVSVHGYYRVLLDTLGRFLRRRLEPRVKLH